MRHRADILALRGLENALKAFSRITPEHLARGLEKQSFGSGNDTLNRKSRVVYAVFATNQIGRDQGSIDPRQDVVVHRIDFAKGRAHLSYLSHEAFRKSGKGNVTFLQIHAFLAE